MTIDEPEKTYTGYSEERVLSLIGCPAKLPCSSDNPVPQGRESYT